DPSQPAAQPRRQRPSSVSYSAPPATPPPRWRLRPGWRISATGELSQTDWCATDALAAMSSAPATVAVFIAAQADREFGPVTIARRAAAFAAAQRTQDHLNPCDSGAAAAVLSGIRRDHGSRPLRKAQPLDLDPAPRGASSPPQPHP